MADVPVILLGDEETVAHCEDLDAEAFRRGCVVAEVFRFPSGAAAGTDDLADLQAVVAALGCAITARRDVWVPFPGPDFVREQHLRRLSLVLQRHGLNLLVTREMYPAPTDGGMNEVDYALRREVQAVDGLDRAVLAAEGAKSLSQEIESVLAAAVTNDPVAVRRAGTARAAEIAKSAGHTGPPALPAPAVPWAQRKPMLTRYARWLVYDCGVTQAATARVLNSSGQRTATGRPWQPGTVSKLLNGKYDTAVRTA
ncbi:hypothetical protein KIH27_12270 [Mycobacterium sp. M1]|uniref:Recombinase family protein n=1 Tax=Mycolicibacter acidiphilus TaxID=2835306 RepID=A0ABS5RJ92_9MYCO|nr:hypothetical protein [Mycolicibacter acidiphilus]MBS9534360.1 hypothetical protein [Mycolicibacter acidiphilus]